MRPSLIPLVRKIRSGEVINIDYAKKDMNDFAIYYERYRPDKVSGTSPYWGTVNLMEEIYTALAKKLGLHLVYGFTSGGFNHYVFPRAISIDMEDSLREIEISIAEASAHPRCVVKEDPFHGDFWSR